MGYFMAAAAVVLIVLFGLLPASVDLAILITAGIWAVPISVIVLAVLGIRHIRRHA